MVCVYRLSLALFCGNIDLTCYDFIEKQENATTVSAHKIVSTLTLLNSGEQLILQNHDGTVVDRANAGNVAWFAGENTETGTAMERSVPVADGTVATSWHSATGDLGDRTGTPGEANSVPPENHAPDAVAGPDQNVAVDQIIYFSAEDSSDLDNDTLSYTWTFGDSTSASGKEVEHAFTVSGTYTVTLKADDKKTTDTDALTVTVTVPSYSDSIFISEFLPDPAGPDTVSEFIELHNTSTSAVDVGGWQLDDADGGSTPFTIPAGSSLRGGGYMAFFRPETKIALNNDGDSVRLLDPNKTVKTSFSYKNEAEEGESYNRHNSSYSFSTTPTPGQANTITARNNEEEDEKDNSSASSSSDTNSRVAGQQLKTIAVAEVREQEIGTTVQTEGLVSVAPGPFGEHILYLSGSGIQVYIPEGKYLDIKVGSRVRIHGERSSYFGEARIKLAAASDIVVVKQEEPPPV